MESGMFEEALGIELLEARHTRALRNQETCSKIRLVHGDFRVVQWWRTPNLRAVFCVATLFDAPLVEEVGKGLQRCPDGVCLVLVGQQLAEFTGLTYLTCKR